MCYHLEVSCRVVVLTEQSAINDFWYSAGARGGGSNNFQAHSARDVTHADGLHYIIIYTYEGELGLWRNTWPVCIYFFWSNTDAVFLISGKNDTRIRNNVYNYYYSHHYYFHDYLVSRRRRRPHTPHLSKHTFYMFTTTSFLYFFFFFGPSLFVW